jgi:hypothetical protein
VVLLLFFGRHPLFRSRKKPKMTSVNDDDAVNEFESKDRPARYFHRTALLRSQLSQSNKSRRCRQPEACVLALLIRQQHGPVAICHRRRWSGQEAGGDSTGGQGPHAPEV